MSLTVEQLIQRKSGIGGSDLAAIVGMSHWRSRMQIYNDKVSDEIDEQQESESMYFGNVLEDVVAKEYQKRTGKKLSLEGEFHTHPTYTWMFANIDRRILSDGGILECKTSGPFAGGDWGDENTDEIPTPYLFQIAHYRIVLDAPYVDLAVLIGGQKFKQYHYEKNANLEDQIITVEHDFWHNHVLTRQPPEPMTYAESALRYSQDNNKIKVAPVEILPLINQLKQVKEQMKELEKIEDQHKRDICNFMEDASTLIDIDGSRLLTWSKAKDSKTFDKEACEKVHPEIIAKFTKTKPGSRRFLIK